VFLLVARPGFEPRQTEPKSVVLPLYYRAACSAERSAKIGENLFAPKFQSKVLKNRFLFAGTAYDSVYRLAVDRDSTGKKKGTKFMFTGSFFYIGKSKGSTNA
jgi:hypothetical protein